MDVRQFRQHRAHRLAQRGVDRVDGAVALGHPHPALGVGAVADPHLHGRLGRELTAGQLVGDHPHRLDAEELRHLTGDSTHQQLERRIGRLEVVTVVFESLEFVDDLVDLGAVEFDADLFGLHLDRRPARHLRHHEPGPVADQFGIDVFVGVLGPHDRRHVQAGLVRERRRSDVRSLRVDGAVEGLRDVVTDRGQTLDAAVGQTGVAELELQVRDDRGEVGVAGALAQPVERALHVARAGLDGGHRVGDRAARVVVAVDPDHRVVTDVGLDVGDDPMDFARQGSTVGVAEHEVARAVDDRGLDRSQGELGVGLVAVEEVLQVDEHHAALAGEELDRVGDHRGAFVEGGLQRLDHLILGTLRDDAHRRGVRLDQIAQRGVVVDLATGASGRAERHQRRRGEFQLVLGAGEELDVLRVGAGPAALDELHPEQVELFRDAELVVDGRRDALDLQAVAQCGVEDFDVSHEVLPRTERAARRAARRTRGGATCSTE